jgi:hypothetical protein
LPNSNYRFASSGTNNTTCRTKTGINRHILYCCVLAVKRSTYNAAAHTTKRTARGCGSVHSESHASGVNYSSREGTSNGTRNSTLPDTLSAPCSHGTTDDRSTNSTDERGGLAFLVNHL